MESETHDFLPVVNILSISWHWKPVFVVGKVAVKNTDMH